MLLVTLDTTRRDHFGCYGNTAPITPNFDSLAAEGIRCDRAYATASVTPVSHASILTGLNPYQHQLRVIAASGGYSLPPEIPTLATILRAHGRRTAAFLSAFPVSEYYGLEHGFDTWDNGLSIAAESVIEQKGDHLTWDPNRHQRRSDETTDRFLAWLEGAGGPFLAWVHYWDPHDPVLRPPPRFMEQFPPAGRRPTDQLRALYAAEVHFVDAQFGRIVATLKRKGLYERTIIVVVSDHGEGLGDHEWWFHRLLFDEQIRVPLLIRLPPRVAGSAATRIIEPVVSTTDILPTVLDYLRVPQPKSIYGRSLRALIEGRPDAPRLAYADQLNKFDLNSNLQKQRPRDGLLYAIVDGDWKLIYNDEHADAHMLFNLAADPEEAQNLYRSQPAKAAEMIRRLEQLAPFRRVPFASGPMDEDALRALKSLGYVGDGAEDEEHDTSSQPTSSPP